MQDPYARFPRGNDAAQALDFIPTPKRVRVVAGGQIVADSRRAILLREVGQPPVYYFPQHDVRMELLEPTEHTTYSPHKGTASYWSIEADGRRYENAVWSYSNTREESPEIEGYVAFDWDQMDAWFEEDEEIYVHARDPFTRVDAAPSSRHVRVVLGGETVAETHRPVLLFETGLPTRYYIPKLDTRLTWLRPSAHRTRCPYKGEAGYYALEIGGRRFDDIAWYYRYPTPAVAAIAGYVCFYNERVDALYVDGELQEPVRRPR